MRSLLAWSGMPALVLALLVVGWGCGDDVGSDRNEGDGGADAAISDAAMPDAAPSEPLLNAPAAEQVGSLELDEPIREVVYVEDLALGFHDDGGVSILDLSDPSEPSVVSNLPTTGRAIAVALDVRLRILFIVTISGDLRAYRVADVTGPVQIAQMAVAGVGADDDGLRGMARVGQRLYVLGAGGLLPISVVIDGSGALAFDPEDAIDLDGGIPQRIAQGGGVIYVVFEGGTLQLWRPGATPTLIEEASLGAQVTGWVVRGRRIFLALRGLGLRVVDFTLPAEPRVAFEATEFSDPAGLVRHGNLVIVALERGLLVALDLSDFDAPRALVARRGALPSWIASIGGNLVLGGGTRLTVFGVPPFVSATVPELSRRAFPRYGSIPLQLSKPVDPATVTLANVRLSCGGTQITGTVVLDLGNMRITFLPSSTLPAGATCRLTLAGVTDAFGLRLTSAASALSFTTVSAEPAPIENPRSAHPHTADGRFTDWTEGDEEDFEYFDVTAARGMYSYFYADYDGERLWLLNDWFYNGDDIEPDCYNQFGVWTGNGQDSWDIRAYGDQHIEVRLNGALLAEDDERVSGGYGHVGSPNDPEPHTVYEISIATEPGSWGVQLHDPGPTFSCHQLETDPTNYNGASTADGSTIDPTQLPEAPIEPVPSNETITTTTPTLSWSVQGDGNEFTTYVFELAAGEDLDDVIYRVVVYGRVLVLPAGLLQAGMTYTWRVLAYNLAGTITSDPVTFTIGEPPPAVVAPVLSSLSPTSVEQGAAATLTLAGTGFVAGARAYLGDTELATTFVSATELTATVPDTLTGTAGAFEVTVRNLADDASTASEPITLNVTEPSSTVVTLVGLDPGAVTVSVGTVVTATMTNAASGSYYLVLTPASGGQALEPVFCDYSGQNQCQATVNVAAIGSYDAKIRVGDAVTGYDTNTLEDELSVNAVSTTVTLVSLSPTMVVAGTSTTVAVTLTNGVAGQYYLVLTPTGGGAGISSFCDWTSMNHCDATVDVAAGSYDAKIQVGEGVGQYDTNTLSSALAAAIPTCHSECLPGMRLSTSCSFCASSVCTSNSACCDSEWGNACVTVADSHGSCSCTAPTLVSLSPSTQDSDDSTAVTADLANAPTGYTYSLTLVPTGMVDGTGFACTHASGTGDCTAMVTGLPVGTYDARVQITELLTGASYVMPTVASAFTVTAASGGGGSCAAPSCMSSGAESCTCTTASGWSMVCTSFQCECLDDNDQFVGDGPSACGSVSAMQEAFGMLCEPCSD